MDSSTNDGLRASRKWVGRILGFTLLILVPLLLALIALGAKFQGLRTNAALEHADLARRLADGEGYTTGSLRPLSLAFDTDPTRHSDLYHAPGHPLVLALAYAVIHPSDRVTATVGLLLWAAVVVLTFFLCRRWFGGGTAVVAAALVICNVALLKGALYGLPYPLCALGMLAVAWLSAPDFGKDPEGDTGSRPSRYRLILAGVAVALTAMTHYVFFFLAPVVGIYVATARGRRWRALGFFALGFGVTLLPWMIHNMARGFSPFFSLFWYEALAGTDAYPGDSVWRTLSASGTSPLGFVLSHPGQVLGKLMTGVGQYWTEIFSATNPVVLFLFVVALFGSATVPRWRAWLIAAAVGMVACSFGACLLRPEPGLLLAWTPVLSIAAAVFVVSWLTERLQAASMRSLWQRNVVARVFGAPERLRATLRISLVGALVMVSAFPLFHFLVAASPERPSAARAAGALAVQRHLAEDGTVMTDQPAFVAWYAQRRSLWLFLDERQWDTLESRCGSIDASYVTPSVAAVAPRETGIWWWWLASPRGAFRKLVPVDPMTPYGVLRVRHPKERG